MSGGVWRIRGGVDGWMMGVIWGEGHWEQRVGSRIWEGRRSGFVVPATLQMTSTEKRNFGKQV